MYAGNIAASVALVPVAPCWRFRRLRWFLSVAAGQPSARVVGLIAPRSKGARARLDKACASVVRAQRWTQRKCVFGWDV
jgi:hypothetical protein